jgi:hypothetical protein
MRTTRQVPLWQQEREKKKENERMISKKRVEDLYILWKENKEATESSKDYLKSRKRKQYIWPSINEQLLFIKRYEKDISSLRCEEEERNGYGPIDMEMKRDEELKIRSRQEALRIKEALSLKIKEEKYIKNRKEMLIRFEGYVMMYILGLLMSLYMRGFV